MFAKSEIRNILFLAERYRAARNLSLKTVSVYAAGRGGFLTELAAGERGITLARRDRILQWFSDHWPDDLEWPAAIPRPPKSTEAA